LIEILQVAPKQEYTYLLTLTTKSLVTFNGIYSWRIFMDITWYGQSCFRIKGKNVAVVTDPYNAEMLGVKKLKVSGDILTVSHQHSDHNEVGVVEGSPFIIEGPGEYEVKGVTIHGMPSFHDGKEGKERGLNTIYTIDIDGVIVCHCGDLGHELSAGQLELLDSVDVLMIPIGGTYTIDAQTAVKVINQVEPKVVIPMHYKFNDSFKLPLSPLSDFLHVYGKKDITPVGKYSTAKDKLPDEQELVILEV
jgi:L-ascorbate metabolism protein UlaG (beta-lactamase superfamily)